MSLLIANKFSEWLVLAVFKGCYQSKTSKQTPGDDELTVLVAEMPFECIINKMIHADSWLKLPLLTSKIYFNGYSSYFSTSIAPALSLDQWNRFSQIHFPMPYLYVLQKLSFCIMFKTTINLCKIGYWNVKYSFSWLQLLFKKLSCSVIDNVCFFLMLKNFSLHSSETRRRNYLQKGYESRMPTVFIMLRNLTFLGTEKSKVVLHLFSF